VTEISQLHQHNITGEKKTLEEPSSQKRKNNESNNNNNNNNNRNIKCQRRVNNLHATVHYTGSSEKYKVQTCITITLRLHRYYIGKQNKF
jgi:hypothetical protein